MKKIILILTILFSTLVMVACEPAPPSSDRTQQVQQEKILAEATAATGMPAMKNFRMKKLLKDIIELQDQDGLVTYTYTFSEMTGRYIFFCDSFGYGIPYATQYTNPQRPAGNWETQMAGNLALPQADPDGLFKPASADGTWVMCKNPNGNEVRPIFIEPRVIVSPFKLPG